MWESLGLMYCVCMWEPLASVCVHVGITGPHVVCVHVGISGPHVSVCACGNHWASCIVCACGNHWPLCVCMWESLGLM